MNFLRAAEFCSREYYVTTELMNLAQGGMTWTSSFRPMTSNRQPLPTTHRRCTSSDDSTTDPEARVRKFSDNGFRPGDNVNFASETQSRSIVGDQVTNAAKELAAGKDPYARKRGDTDEVANQFPRRNSPATITSEAVAPTILCSANDRQANLFTASESPAQEFCDVSSSLDLGRAPHPPRRSH